MSSAVILSSLLQRCDLACSSLLRARDSSASVKPSLIASAASSPVRDDAVAVLRRIAPFNAEIGPVATSGGLKLASTLYDRPSLLARRSAVVIIRAGYPPNGDGKTQPAASASLALVEETTSRARWLCPEPPRSACCRAASGAGRRPANVGWRLRPPTLEQRCLLHYTLWRGCPPPPPIWLAPSCAATPLHLRSLIS